MPMRRLIAGIGLFIEFLGFFVVGRTAGAETPLLSDFFSGRRDSAKVSPATMPQFWLTDASIFIHNAASVVSGIFRERKLGFRDVGLLANQARAASKLLARARSSLRTLEANAEASNPEAVPAIRSAVRELAQARKKLVGALRQGASGKNSQGIEVIALRPVLAHLKAAQRRLPAVARRYLDGGGALTFIPLDGDPSDRGMAGVSRAGRGK